MPQQQLLRGQELAAAATLRFSTRLGTAAIGFILPWPCCLYTPLLGSLTMHGKGGLLVRLDFSCSSGRRGIDEAEVAIPRRAVSGTGDLPRIRRAFLTEESGMTNEARSTRLALGRCQCTVRGEGHLLLVPHSAEANRASLEEHEQVEAMSAGRCCNPGRNS